MGTRESAVETDSEAREENPALEDKMDFQV